MLKKTIKAGIIGSGFSAAFHYEALMRVYGVSVDIIGVYSPNKKNCLKFAQERDLTPYESPQKLMEDCDSLHLCTPPATHEDLALKALAKGKHVIVEKPFTGYFGGGEEGFSGDTFNRQTGLAEAKASLQRIRKAEKESSGTVFYAENWVYAPAVQKEREILEKAGGQILWMQGQESHSGSHSPYYGDWSFSGGGSLLGKGVHPLTAILYLKSVEGKARRGKPIRPASVTARTHSLTRGENYQDDGFLKKDYKDIEDFGVMHITFEDGTIADVFASEIIMGGVHNHLEVNASNHRTIVNINPNSAMQTYNPENTQFKDIYVVEKIGTKEGWANTSPDEDWFTGYQHEMQHFYGNMARSEEPESGSLLASDTIMTVYSAYLSAERSGQEVVIDLI